MPGTQEPSGHRRRADTFLAGVGVAAIVSGSELSLRRTRPGEVPEVVDLVNDAYGRTETESGWTSEDEILDGPRVQAADVREILERPASAMLVAELEGEIVAAGHVQELEPGVSEIGMLSVRPELQAKGLGREVLARAEDFARAEQEAQRVVLHVLTIREELLEWYERRGYERTGETKPFEPEEPQRSLVGPLAFEVLEKRWSEP